MQSTVLFEPSRCHGENVAIGAQLQLARQEVSRASCQRLTILFCCHSVFLAGINGFFFAGRNTLPARFFCWNHRIFLLEPASSFATKELSEFCCCDFLL